MHTNEAIDTLVEAIETRTPDEKAQSRIPTDAERQLKLLELFLNRSTPEEGYIIATLGTAIRLNRVAELWERIAPLAEELTAELNRTS